MSIPTDFQLDRQLVRQHFNDSAATADKADFLAREVSRRMAERLDYIRVSPTRILDLGCGTGRDLPGFAERYPQAERIGIDFARSLLASGQQYGGFLQRLFSRSKAPQLLCADAEALPLQRASVQMVWSNLMLNWFHEPMPALREMHRVLAVDGLLMFSTLGPDTLRELRAALPTTGGERVHRFIDMHDLGDCLLNAGFSEPVMDMEVITLTYTDLDGLLGELQQAGASNASGARPRGLTGKGNWQRARQAYDRLRTEGRLPATFEIVYGHAWKTAPKKLEDGRSVISFKPRT
ncbi:methyltransferase domain-containing protein [Uliginosibacterium sp. H3]|uniref:Malonyl-[acyl-carrier protein] O-methyltransferase n=1 Tax=Uliginosibacterium silvisoli TaxID=3114758 RepID=A0ABU6K7D3_9RHOO|nr:methyltransferase domain-containing protein [Uliginosibacterium sp. H3]